MNADFPRDDAFPKNIALVLPGGFVTGGALQVGFLKALKESGLLDKVSFIAGTSVGALNGSLAALGEVGKLEKIWLSLRPRDVFRRKAFLYLVWSQFAVWIAGKLGVLDSHRATRILSRRLHKFLRDPIFHANSLNAFVLAETIRKKINMREVGRRIVAGPTQFMVTVVNAIRWQMEVYSFGNGKAKRIDMRFPEDINPELIDEIVFTSCSVPVVFPMRQIGSDWYFDGAVLKPNPLSYAFDTDCDLIIAFGSVPQPANLCPVAIEQVMERVVQIEQYERFMREFQVAREKSRDILTLQQMIKSINAAVDHFVGEAKQSACLKRAIDYASASAQFSFRHDKVIPLIIVAPAWEPEANVEIYGGYGDFSLVPELITRGYKETIRILREERLINCE